MPSGSKDYYKTLQVDPHAESEVIEAAFKRLAHKYHPDKSRASDATARMQELIAAYEVLRDPIKRRQYDQGRVSRSSGLEGDFEEERRRREEAERSDRRAQGEAREARRRAAEAQRMREEAEAARWRAQAEAEAARRYAEGENRKRREAETAGHGAEGERPREGESKAAGHDAQDVLREGTWPDERQRHAKGTQPSESTGQDRERDGLGSKAPKQDNRAGVRNGEATAPRSAKPGVRHGRVSQGRSWMVPVLLTLIVASAIYYFSWQYVTRRLAAEEVRVAQDLHSATSPIGNDGDSDIASFYAFDSPPRPARKPAPEYPEVALVTGAEGTVWVEVTIDENGRVIAARVVRSTAIQVLNEAAREAAMKWLFTAAKLHGVPVKSRISIPFEFSVRDR